MVGDTGLEPVTSTMSTWRSNIRAYSVPTPLKFDFSTRQCPPKFSWEK